MKGADQSLAMIKFYLSTPLMWNSPVEELFRTAAAYSAGLEIFHQQMEYHGVAPAAVQALIEQYAMPVFVHAFSWDLNLCSLQKPVRDVAVEQTKQSIAYARMLGAQDVTIHPGRMSIALENDSYDRHMHDSMEKLMDYAGSLSQSISFEIMEPVGKEFITDRHVMERVAGDLWENMKVTLDLAHCRDEVMIRDHLQNLPRISKLHISNHTKGKYHTPVSEGDLDFRALKPDILQSGLPLVVEGMDVDTNKELVSKNMHYLQEEYGNEME